ncbi:MAG: DNA repair protein RecO [Candidatus Kinetoplastibacterium crithidii]|nr:DNA repair protein RecO [Candidatus Kinetoplastibacterium crithidii]
MNKKNLRIKEDIGYILHSISWKETSLIVKVFSREYGCINMVAKGAKRPYSQLRPVLSKFTPLLLRWTGKSEVKTLVKAELNGIISLPGKFLIFAWYLNELILSFLPKEDSHPILFDAYHNALLKFCDHHEKNSKNISSILRRFEWTLLKEIGYGFDQEEPDFCNLLESSFINQIMSDRIETYLYGRTLHSRKILKDLKHFI